MDYGGIEPWWFDTAAIELNAIVFSSNKHVLTHNIDFSLPHTTKCRYYFNKTKNLGKLKKYIVWNSMKINWFQQASYIPIKGSIAHAKAINSSWAHLDDIFATMQSSTVYTSWWSSWAGDVVGDTSWWSSWAGNVVGASNCPIPLSP